MKIRTHVCTIGTVKLENDQRLSLATNDYEKNRIVLFHRDVLRFIDRDVKIRAEIYSFCSVASKYSNIW
jgi:hypothetical protein